MLKLFFRILLFGLGIFTLYFFGGNIVKVFSYRMTGEVVEGRIVGFAAGRTGNTMVEDGSGRRNGKTKARRPFFRYPTAAGSTDSLTERSDVSASTLSNYEIGEKVTVVFSKDKPQDSYIFGTQVILFNLLVICLGLFMLWMGIGGKL
jgi:Protein of unknown function (DUF3592)